MVTFAHAQLCPSLPKQFDILQCTLMDEWGGEPHCSDSAPWQPVAYDDRKTIIEDTKGWEGVKVGWKGEGGVEEGKVEWRRGGGGGGGVEEGREVDGGPSILQTDMNFELMCHAQF